MPLRKNLAAVPVRLVRGFSMWTVCAQWKDQNEANTHITRTSYNTMTKAASMCESLGIDGFENKYPEELWIEYEHPAESEILFGSDVDKCRELVCKVNMELLQKGN